MSEGSRRRVEVATKASRIKAKLRSNDRERIMIEQSDGDVPQMRRDARVFGIASPPVIESGASSKQRVRRRKRH